jgi:hypothetical protein
MTPYEMNGEECKEMHEHACEKQVLSSAHRAESSYQEITIGKH